MKQGQALSIAEPAVEHIRSIGVHDAREADEALAVFYPFAGLAVVVLILLPPAAGHDVAVAHDDAFDNLFVHCPILQMQLTLTDYGRATRLSAAVGAAC